MSDGQSLMLESREWRTPAAGGYRSKGDFSNLSHMQPCSLVKLALFCARWIATDDRHVASM